MTVFIALLRVVNVGGTGKMPMSDLRRLCESAGFAAVRTYIASGNVVFESEVSEAEVKAALEEKLPESRSAFSFAAPPRWPRCWQPTHSPAPRRTAPLRSS